MGKLDNRVALVTGAARKSGIGFGIAKKFAEEGAIVILNDILDSIKDRESDLKNLGYHTKAFVVDLTNLTMCEDMVASIISEFGHLDIVCNNAGKSIPPRPPFVEMSEEYFDKVLDRNLKTTFICCKAVVPQMIQQNYGRIVNISSVSGNRVVYRYSAAYSAAKGAVSALTRALALELGEHNITANAILPGNIDVDEDPWTPANDKFGYNKTPKKLRYAMHRPGFPKDIGALASFLASEECSWLTGEEIVIDGGSIILEPATTSEELFGEPPK